jgi:hypothetical protein
VAAHDFVARFVAASQWTGQISFDLMQMPDGRVLPLECNPRATSGLHFFADPGAFAGAILDAKVCKGPDVTQPQMVPLAMWIYGFPTALRQARIAQYLADYRAAHNLLNWPDDPRPKRAQFRALAEIAGLAVAKRCSLQVASTWDIEWNGPDQSMI